MSLLLKGLFVVVIGAVLCLAAAIRPGQTSPRRWWVLAIWFFVGVVVGLVFLSTNSLYA